MSPGFCLKTLFCHCKQLKMAWREISFDHTTCQQKQGKVTCYLYLRDPESYSKLFWLPLQHFLCINRTMLIIATWLLCKHAGSHVCVYCSRGLFKELLKTSGRLSVQNKTYLGNEVPSSVFRRPSAPTTTSKSKSTIV